MQMWHPGRPSDASETQMSELGRSMINAGLIIRSQFCVANGGMRHGDDDEALRTVEKKQGKRGLSIPLVKN